MVSSQALQYRPGKGSMKPSSIKHVSHLQFHMIIRDVNMTEQIRIVHRAELIDLQLTSININLYPVEGIVCRYACMPFEILVL